MEIKLRHGIAIIELIVYCLILGVLALLLFPALQSVRESARSSTCLDRLRQISLAGQSYLSLNSRFPPGTLGIADHISLTSHPPADFLRPGSEIYWKNYQHSSYLVFLLPHMELQSVSGEIPSQLIDIRKTYLEAYGGSPPYSWAGEIPSVAELMTQGFKEFFCPSDSLSNGFGSSELVLVGRQPTFDSSNSTDGYLSFQLEASAVARFGLNYYGCAGALSGGNVSDPTRSVFRGVLGSRLTNREVDIRDGLSNTIFVAEGLGGISNGKRIGGLTWCFGGIARGRGKLAWGVPGGPEYGYLFGDSMDSSIAGFGSVHPTVVNATFSDGRTARIQRAVNLKIWYGSCGISDGIVVNFLE